MRKPFVRLGLVFMLACTLAVSTLAFTSHSAKAAWGGGCDYAEKGFAGNLDGFSIDYCISVNGNTVMPDAYVSHAWGLPWPGMTCSLRVNLLRGDGWLKQGGSRDCSHAIVWGSYEYFTGASANAWDSQVWQVMVSMNVDTGLGSNYYEFWGPQIYMW